MIGDLLHSIYSIGMSVIWFIRLFFNKLNDKILIFREIGKFSYI